MVLTSIDEIAVDHLDTAALSGEHSVAATPPARPSPGKAILFSMSSVDFDDGEYS